MGREILFPFGVQLLSRVRLFATPWTSACHAAAIIIPQALELMESFNSNF